MKCNQCHSDNVIEHLRVLDRIGEDSEGDLAVETHLSPHSLFLTDKVSVPLAANICAVCGHVMFSVSDKQGLDTIREAAAAFDAAKSSGEDLNSSPGFGSFLGKDKSASEPDSDSDSE